jgi:type III restriction enzyme
MIQLKDYQQRVLDSLREFLSESVQKNDPAAAYELVTAKVYGQPLTYCKIPDPRFEFMPYVCVRVPTGGGKTLLACHTVGIALNRFLPAPHAVVLWLVPSNTILDQTADALRDPRHPYRRALDLECGGPVEVLTIEEALRMTRAAVEGQTVVIIATIQCFRTSDPEGRKVNDGTNGHMKDLVAAIPRDRYADMDLGPDGRPAPSLINVLRHRRPIIIVDEAHNVRTKLSFATLANAYPSCIIEFTATPDTKENPSNVLHRVSAAELKAANMVKLPLRVVTRAPGQQDQLLAEAIGLRRNLEALAIQEAEDGGTYIRPILLIQAARVDACEPLRDTLVSDFGLARDEIRISTGKLDELKGVTNITSPDCPIRFIITVEKLREGWDCPFAYVLCSLRGTRSATAIEQIVGRILRLPGATPKRQDSLNCAYMFALAEGNHLEEVLAELRDALVSNGFTAGEAERVIMPVGQTILPLGSQPQTVNVGVGNIDVCAARAYKADLAGKVLVEVEQGRITVIVPLTQEDEDKLLACVKTEVGRVGVSAAVETVRSIERAFGDGKPRTATPYELQADFFVPLLSVAESGRYFEFERSHLIEHPWKLSAKDASLPPEYDPRRRPGARLGSVDIGDRGAVQTEASRESDGADFVGKLHQQVLGLDRAEDWTLEEVVAWLDSKIEHRDITPGESAEFLRKCIRGLQARLGVEDVGVLALDRFRLREHIEQRIATHREEERQSAFQQWLLPESGLAVVSERGIDFKAQLYEPSWPFDGSFVFKKHYYGSKPGELHERKADRSLSEEFQCAQFLDGLDDVEYWIRNLPRKATSFRLQTSTDFFYPDFVCRLTDGRVLVVEYKGGHLYDGVDAEEKRLVGAVWEARSGRRCLFVMPSKLDWSSIIAKIP